MLTRPRSVVTPSDLTRQCDRTNCTPHPEVRVRFFRAEQERLIVLRALGS